MLYGVRMQTFTILGQAVQSKHVPLYCHAHGLMQTATGYGKRIATATMVNYKGKWRRVYCAIYSNIGTCYIGKREDNLIVQ
jgi:hypothetical protein